MCFFLFVEIIYFVVLLYCLLLKILRCLFFTFFIFFYTNLIKQLLRSVFYCMCLLLINKYYIIRLVWYQKLAMSKINPPLCMNNNTLLLWLFIGFHTRDLLIGVMITLDRVERPISFCDVSSLICQKNNNNISSVCIIIIKRRRRNSLCSEIYYCRLLQPPTGVVYYYMNN